TGHGLVIGIGDGEIPEVGRGRGNRAVDGGVVADLERRASGDGRGADAAGGIAKLRCAGVDGQGADVGGGVVDGEVAGVDGDRAVADVSGEGAAVEEGAA